MSTTAPGRSPGRPRLLRPRQLSETGAFSRNWSLSLGLALLLCVCLLRISAEAWHRSGGGSFYLLSAFADKSTLPGLDSVYSYTENKPPVPMETVLTTGVVHGMLPWRRCMRQHL